MALHNNNNNNNTCLFRTTVHKKKKKNIQETKQEQVEKIKIKINLDYLAIAPISEQK